MSDLTQGDAAAIRLDIRDLRADVTTRMDQAVTRREHEAEVRRIDAEAQAVRESLERHETSADRRLDTLRATIEALTGAVAAGDREVLAVVEADRAAHIAEREDDRKKAAQAKKDAADQRKSDRRWLVGTMIAAVAVILTATQVLRAFF